MIARNRFDVGDAVRYAVRPESRRGGRVVECASFENWLPSNGYGSSNLPFSA